MKRLKKEKTDKPETTEKEIKSEEKQGEKEKGQKVKDDSKPEVAPGIELNVPASTIEKVKPQVKVSV